jgi:hypothetical protein
MIYPASQRTEGSLLRMLHCEECGNRAIGLGSNGTDPLAPTTRPTMLGRSHRSPWSFSWSLPALSRR